MIPLLAAILDDSAFNDVVDIVAVAPLGSNNDADQLRDALCHKSNVLTLDGPRVIKRESEI